MNALSQTSSPCARPVILACAPARRRPQISFVVSRACKSVAKTARTQLSNPAAPANPREMAKKKKAAPEEEAPKKGKKKAAVKK